MQNHLLILRYSNYVFSEVMSCHVIKKSTFPEKVSFLIHQTNHLATQQWTHEQPMTYVCVTIPE